MIDREELVALLMAANLTADQLADTESDALGVLWMHGPAILNMRNDLTDYAHMLVLPHNSADDGEAVAHYDKLLTGADGWRQTLTLMREMEAANDA